MMNRLLFTLTGLQAAMEKALTGLSAVDPDLLENWLRCLNECIEECRRAKK